MPKQTVNFSCRPGKLYFSGLFIIFEISGYQVPRYFSLVSASLLSFSQLLFITYYWDLPVSKLSCHTAQILA